MTERTPSRPSLEERLRSVELRQLDMRDLEPRGPHVDPSWLRDHAAPLRVERVWQRLEGSLPRAPRRGRWSPAATLVGAAAIFAFGLWMGRATRPEQVVEVASREVERRVEPEQPAATGAPEPTSERTSRAPVAARRNEARRPARPTHVARSPLPSVASASVEPVVTEVPLVVEGPALAPRWLTLANRGEYAAAFQAVDEEGGFDVVVNRASAEELMTLADVARAAGQPGRAVQALRGVISRDASDPNAPVAAMLLGNLLQRSGDYAGAAEAYELNRRLSPRGDFAEDALARQFEVALERGDLTRARALSAQYETEFPEGRRRGEIREQLDRAESEREAASSGEESSAPAAEDEPGAAEDREPGAQAEAEERPGVAPRASAP